MREFCDRATTMKFGRFDLPTIISIALIIIFTAVSTFVALNLKREIIPDEQAHLVISEHFSTSWGVPPDNPQTYPYGLIAQKPFLYYWINGRFLNLLGRIFSEPGSWKTLAILRMMSVFYSTLAVIFCYLLAKEVVENSWWRILIVFLLTNTLMYVLLSGGANYDNFVNLCSFAGIYFLIKVLKGKSFYIYSLGWMICILTGTLVKITALPLLAILTVVWGIYFCGNNRRFDIKLPDRWKTAFLLVIFVVLGILNFSIYGMNLIKYRAVIPSCTMVLSESQCAQSAIYQRDQAAAEHFSISDMFNGNVPDPVTWFRDFWAPSMLKMIFGFTGGRTYTPSSLTITLYGLWFIGMLLLVAWHHKKITLPILGLLMIVVFYFLILIQTNLSSELNTGFKHLGIQGRYFFPAIGGLFVLLVYFAAQISNKVVAGATFATTVALFFFNGPLWILLFPAAVQFPSPAIAPEEATITLPVGSNVSQDIRSECLGTITQVEILFSTESATAAYPITLQLIDTETHQLVIEQSEMISPGNHQAQQVFPIHVPQNTKDHNYRISLSTLGSTQEPALRLWNTKTNIYLGGDAIVNGVPLNNDLVFQYTCKMPLLKDWFIK